MQFSVIAAVIALLASSSAFVAPSVGRVGTSIKAAGAEDKGKQAREWGERANAAKNSTGEKKGQPDKQNSARIADNQGGEKKGLDKDQAALNSVMGQHDVDEAKEGIERRFTMSPKSAGAPGKE